MSEPRGFPPYEPDRSGDEPGRGERLPAPRPSRAATPGHLVGRADGVTVRNESVGSDRSTTTTTILTFRLADSSDGRPVEVELRGSSLRGSVRDGDWVEVPAKAGRTGRIDTQTLTNLTTGSQVSTALTGSSKVFRVFFFVVLAFILLVFGLLAAGLVFDVGPFGTFDGF